MGRRGGGAQAWGVEGGALRGGACHLLHPPKDDAAAVQRGRRAGACGTNHRAQDADNQHSGELTIASMPERVDGGIVLMTRSTEDPLDEVILLVRNSEPTMRESPMLSGWLARRATAQIGCERAKHRLVWVAIGEF